MNKKTITITADVQVYFAPGDRVRLKHRPDIKGTVVRISSWHSYNSVVLRDGAPAHLDVSHYDIQHDDGTRCFTSKPDEYELDSD